MSLITSPKKIMVGVGEFAVTREPGAALKTMALGSCVALLIRDRVTSCVGMAHVALPDSTISPERARTRPGHFADTAVPVLIQAMERAVASKIDTRKLQVKLVGGANVADPANTFNIGKRNIMALRKALWAHRLGPMAEDVGKNVSRTVTYYADDGRVVVNNPKIGDWEL